MKRLGAGLFFFVPTLLITFISCTSLETSPEGVSPADADVPTVDDKLPEVKDTRSERPSANIDSPLLQLAMYAPLPEVRELDLRLFPQNTEVFIRENDSLVRLSPSRTENDHSWYTTDAGALWLTAPEFKSVLLPLRSSSLEAKLERSDSTLTIIGELPTRHQPKSIRFSQDGKSMYVAHLGDHRAVSRYSVEPFQWIEDWNVPEQYAGDSGFVETLILPNHRELWLSQMTRNTIHVFDLDTGSHKAAIAVSGAWPKVLVATSDESKVYTSCWLSETVVEIDTATRKERRAFPVSGTPRGMILSPDENELLVTIFSASSVDRIDIASGTLLKTHDVAPGRAYAMRHIVHDEIRGEYYITAMGVARVYRMSEDGEWLGSWKVGEKPNTCAISPDGSRLFVSCRGPNNPDIGYLYRGYEYGKVYMINLENEEVDGWIWGRDQTTGLDLSPDGRFLAFTDFLSHNLELYRINR